MPQRVCDPQFRSLAAGFFNVIPKLTFWDVVSDIADGYSVTYEYHECTFSWDASKDAPPTGFVAFELFEDRYVVSGDEFLSILREALETEAKTNPPKNRDLQELLDKVSARF